MSEEGQGRGTRARLRRGNVQVLGQVPVVEPFVTVRCGSGEEGLMEVGLSTEYVNAVRWARAGGWIILHPGPRRQRIVYTGGHRGRGRGTRNGGRG